MVGIPGKALILYSGLIVTKVVACVFTTKYIHTYIYMHIYIYIYIYIYMFHTLIFSYDSVCPCVAMAIYLIM